MNHPATAISGWRRTSTDLFLIAIAIAVPVMSWAWARWNADSAWFARSGSIMVVIGIILESRLFIVKQVLFQLNQQDGQGEVRAPDGMGLQKLESWLTHIILIVGTIIWGYGDIVLSRLVFHA